MSFNVFINNRRKELNMSVDDLVIKSKVPKGTLSKITAGINTNPTLSTVEALCKALNCSLDDAVDFERKNTFTSKEKCLIDKYRLLDSHGIDMVDTVLQKEYDRCTEEPEKSEYKIISIHFINAPVSAGIGDMLNDYENVETVNVPLTRESYKADFVLRVYGRSMEPMYSDGDYVLVRQQEAVDIGQIGIFAVDGDGYIKKMGKNKLISVNRDFDDVELHEYTNFKCFGLVLGTTEIIEE